MKHLILYPDATRLLRSGVLGAVLFACGLSLLTGNVAGLITSVLGAVLAAAGLVRLAQVGRVVANWSASFEADAGGFSVMGQPKLPWSEYHSVGVASRKIGKWTISETVRIRTGLGPRSGAVFIPPLHLPGSAGSAASLIENYGYAMLDPAAGAIRRVPQAIEAAASDMADWQGDWQRDWSAAEDEVLIPLLDEDSPPAALAEITPEARVIDTAEARVGDAPEAEAVRTPEAQVDSPHAEDAPQTPPDRIDHVFSSRRRRLESAA